MVAEKWANPIRGRGILGGVLQSIVWFLAPVCLSPLLLVCLSLLLSDQGMLWADIRLPKVFADSMVLQRQAEVHLRGQADPDEALVISISGQSIERREIKTQCDSTGEFSVRFAPPPVGGPYQLSVSGQKSKIVIRDVMVGDVWLCSGQSNMDLSIAKADPNEVPAAEQLSPQIRLMTIPRTASPHPLSDFTGNLSWEPAKPEVVAAFSAVGWHFGQQLQSELEVPIGLIQASWTGTRCEAWISQESLEGEARLAPLRDFAASLGDGVKPQDRLGGVFNGMIAPIGDFPIKGVIWYQGEANVGRGDQYRVLLPLLIRDWRQRLGSPQLPFVLVQLPPYRYQNNVPAALPEIWDAQLHTFMNVPRTGLIVSTDLGDPRELHPRRKRELGRRLSGWAMAEVYQGRRMLPERDAASEATNGELAVQREANGAIRSVGPPNGNGDRGPSPSVRPLYSGPIFRDLERRDRTMILRFFASRGLRSADQQSLREFQMAGPDREFHAAQAVIIDNRVHVECPEVDEPVAVRFAWSDTPSPNLVNEAGLPASPFRTDDFPLLSVGKDY